MIKVVAPVTIVCSAILAVVSLLIWGQDSMESSLLGSAVMLINLIGIWFFWKLVFLKKSIAFVVLVIIFKYLILGVILWNLTQAPWFQPIGFLIGLSALLFGMVLSVFFKNVLFKIKR